MRASILLPALLGRCDDTCQRCARRCASPAASAKPSEVLTRQALARTAKP